jgi:nucleoside-diphosphate-sugar epimerase
MRILVTGASGFIGRAACRGFAARGHQVRAAVRTAASALRLEAFEPCTVGEVDGNTDWAGAVDGIDAIVHLAGRAHILGADAIQTAQAFRSVNVDGAVNLLRAAQDAGVRRFVNVSSIGVLAQSTEAEPLTDASTPRPSNPYAQSKLDSEIALGSAATRIELVSVRPPMVYGPGNPGNMQRLIRLVGTGLPLPLALAHGQRDMIGIDNLVDILAVCAAHPEVAGQTYAVCDGEPVSTAELIRMLGASMGRKPVLLPVPQGLLSTAAGWVGRADDVGRLFKPLRIDDRRFRAQTGWTPVTPLAQGLARTVGAAKGA